MSWELGKWYTHKGKLKMCESGFHLTVDPSKWLSEGYDVFFAEAEGVKEWNEDKCVCRKVRLLSKVSLKTLAEYEKIRQPALAEYRVKCLKAIRKLSKIR